MDSAFIDLDDLEEDGGLLIKYHNVDSKSYRIIESGKLLKIIFAYKGAYLPVYISILKLLPKCHFYHFICNHYLPNLLNTIYVSADHSKYGSLAVRQDQKQLFL